MEADFSEVAVLFGRLRQQAGFANRRTVMRLSAAVQHIRHIAASGLPSRIAVAEMTEALQAVAPSRTNVFIWLDDNFLPCDYYQRDIVPEAYDAFVRDAPRLARTDEPSIDKLARSPVDYGACVALPHLPGWNRSVMKNELFDRLGIGNNLDFTIRDRGVARGLLAVNREPESAAFTRTELDAILGLRNHFVHAMNAPATLDEALSPDGEIAVLTLAADGAIVDLGPRAAGLVHQLRGARSVLSGFAHQSAPKPMIEARQRLVAALDGQIGGAPTVDVQTVWGAFRVIAHFLDGQGVATLTLQKMLPHKVKRLRRVALLDLSPRERQIAVAMCCPGTGDDVAVACGVTVSSYREYTRRIYTRLGVEGRDGVRAALDS
jgi:DNA-binding NarL/FixJ family response regulator